MLIFSTEIFSDDNMVNNIHKYFENSVKLQQEYKKNILNYMQEFADSTVDIHSDYVDTILKFLEDLKNSLKMCNDNLDHFKTIKSSFNDLLGTYKNNSLEDNRIIEFNSNFVKLNNTILENTLEINLILNSILTYSNLNFSTSNASTNEVVPTKPNIAKEENSSNEFVENTLIVSESKGKVFLPYTLNELNEILEENSDKYSSLYDIVEDKFTLPFSLFKNLPIARFREAFKLARYKEKESVKSAFDLGLELLFNYNLHPSIISACRNMNELDIYLDYLDSNESDKFDCFKIVFDIAPVLKKN